MNEKVYTEMNLETKSIRRKNPINRNNFFTSEGEISFEQSIAMEYINNQINQTVVLYEVDLENTKSNDIYHESDFNNMTFKTPVELNVRYRLDKAELKTYDTNTIKGYYLKIGKLTFDIMCTELAENDCDIKRGDYIGLQVTPEHMEYFIVADDGRANYDNAHTWWGTVPYYRSIVCTTVGDKTETQNL